MLRLFFPVPRKPVTTDLSHAPSMENESSFRGEVHACPHEQNVMPQRVSAVLGGTCL